jgi:hypothetical protein
MRFLSWLGAILILLLIIAVFTAPGEQKFSNFINKDKGGDTMSCKPVIGKTTQIKVFAKIATVQTVSFCESNSYRLPATDKVTNPGKITIPKNIRTETYLGLFGKFWKI